MRERYMQNCSASVNQVRSSRCAAVRYGAQQWRAGAANRAEPAESAMKWWVEPEPNEPNQEPNETGNEERRRQE